MYNFQSFVAENHNDFLMGGGQCSLLWLNATIRFSLHKLSDHLLKDVRYFTAEGGHNLLWPDATTFLNHSGASSRPEETIIAVARGHMFLLNHNFGHFEKVCGFIIYPTLRQMLLCRSIMHILASFGAKLCNLTHISDKLSI